MELNNAALLNLLGIGQGSSSEELSGTVSSSNKSEVDPENSEFSKLLSSLKFQNDLTDQVKGDIDGGESVTETSQTSKEGSSDVEITDLLNDLKESLSNSSDVLVDSKLETVNLESKPTIKDDADISKILGNSSDIQNNTKNEDNLDSVDVAKKIDTLFEGKSTEIPIRKKTDSLSQGLEEMSSSKAKLSSLSGKDNIEASLKNLNLTSSINEDKKQKTLNLTSSINENKKTNTLKNSIDSSKNIEDVLVSNNNFSNHKKMSMKNALGNYLTNKSDASLLSQSILSTPSNLAAVSKDKSIDGSDIETVLSPLSLVGEKNSSVLEQSKNNTKILDLSNINSSNTDDLINTISDYVVKNNFESKKSLDLLVKHNSLGEFSLNVNSGNKGEDIAIKIATASGDAHRFFVENETGLMKALTNSGLKITDFKVISRFDTFSNMSFDSNESSSKEGMSQGFGRNSQNSGDQRGQQQNDTSRRYNMWEEARERMGA